MTIERTDQWLEKDFHTPIKICGKLVSSSVEKDAHKLYDYLVSFGMYRPNWMAKEIFNEMKKADVWSKVERIVNQYQKKWRGPDIPVYIFPMSRMRNGKMDDKAGVSFKNKMFLFLTPLKDEKELEALIVHEYHHVCRLNKLAKPLDEYTLIDSIVMEGFAEYVVTKYCGKEYNARWISFYTSEELEYFWEKYLNENLQAKRTEKIHDSLLFGRGSFPDLLGYAAGYQLIANLGKKQNITIRDSFSMKTEEVVDRFGLLD